MSNYNENLLHKMAEAMIKVDPTISFEPDEIVAEIKANGLSAFIKDSSTIIRELFETVDLMPNLINEELDNES